MNHSKLIKQLTDLLSEAQNPATMAIDCLDTLPLVTLLNQQDQGVAEAVSKILPDLSLAVDCIVAAFKQGGRLVYLGAGSSGRLGVLDAVECVPTFSVDEGQVVALIAGGQAAMFKAQEGSEDNPQIGVDDLKAIHFCSQDVLVGIAASGRTPYVIGALKYAQELGASTIAISCNPNAEVIQHADIALLAIVGPEALAGSTRMKSGTAQKMLLNILSTASMIRIGKSYKNWMIDLTASNEKLYVRSIHMLMQITGADQEEAEKALQLADSQVKLAALMLMAKIDFQTASHLLKQTDGFLSNALQLAQQSSK